MMTEDTKIRFKFIKIKEFKYLSHLETVRLITMAVRRSGIDIKYSEGFNPNPKINFSFPVPVGLSSMAEYSDIEINGKQIPEDFKELMNCQLGEHMRITEAKSVLVKVPSLMGDIGFCSYCYQLKGMSENMENKIRDSILNHPEFSGSVSRLTLNFHEVDSDIVNLNVIGYTKLLKNNKIFKFNDFLKYFKYLSNNNGIVVEDYFKEEAYVLREGKLKTPLEIV